MKLIFRIVAILTAALVVAGAMLALRQANALPLAGFDGPGRPQFEGGEARPGFFQPNPGGFEGRDRDRHGDRGGSLFGLGEIIKNLVIIGAIVVLGALVTWLIGSTKRREITPAIETEPPS